MIPHPIVALLVFTSVAATIVEVAYRPARIRDLSTRRDATAAAPEATVVYM